MIGGNQLIGLAGRASSDVALARADLSTHGDVLCCPAVHCAAFKVSLDSRAGFFPLSVDEIVGISSPSDSMSIIFAVTGGLPSNVRARNRN